MRKQLLALSLVLCIETPVLASDAFHLFAGIDERVPVVIGLEMEGLPPGRPLTGVGGGGSAPSGPGPAPSAKKKLPPYPTDKNFGLAAAEVIGLNLLPWAFNRYVTNGDFAYISFSTIKYNYQSGFTYDHDNFKTNQSSHPFHGSLFFNSARSNGFTFWESAPFALAGSFLWELHMENEPPSINDIVNTTLGGMTRGEVMHRVSNMILDNTKSGSSRFWREAGGLVTNPIGGFNRLIKGQMWSDFENPADRFPSRFYLEADVLYRGRNGSAVGDEDTNQGGLSILMRYGDPFEGDHKTPFEYFDLTADLVQPAATLVTKIESRGLLTQWNLTEGTSSGQRLGLFLHFNYFNNDPVVYGSSAFSADYQMRVPLGGETDLRTDFAVLGLPMAGVQADHNRPGTDPDVRSYDFGPGGGARATVSVRRREMDLLVLDYQVIWQHTSNGVSRNNRIQALTAEGRFPLGKHLAVGAGWTWGERLSTYDLFPTVDVKGTSWKIFGAYAFKETYAQTASGTVPSAASPPSADPKGRWEISGFGGGFFGSRVLTSPTLNVMTATAPTFGARVGYGLTHAFSLEASWSHADSRLEPQNPATSQPAGPDTDLTINTYELDGLFGFGSGCLRGYVGLGGGIMTMDPNVPTLDSTGGTSAFAANIAAGGKYYVTEHFALRADFRYRWRAGDNRLGVIVCHESGCRPFTTNLYSSLDLTGGLTYRF